MKKKYPLTFNEIHDNSNPNLKRSNDIITTDDHMAVKKIQQNDQLIAHHDDDDYTIEIDSE